MKNEELRYYNCDVEVREADDDKPAQLVGYAAVFDKLSENLGGFREKIAPGAFDNVLKDDVRAVFNHDGNFVLGRTKSGTLRLSVDANGLRYGVDLPNTSAGRDIMESVKRGDIDGSSFKFRVDSDTWEEDEDGRTIRTINTFARLIDVGPVTFPAYPDASVAKRSLEEAKKAKIACNDRVRDLKLNLLKVSL